MVQKNLRVDTKSIYKVHIFLKPHATRKSIEKSFSSYLSKGPYLACTLGGIHALEQDFVPGQPNFLLRKD